MSNSSPSKKIRVAIYIRVSTEEQAKKGHGLASQLRLCENEISKFADRGWVFDEKLIYRDDGYSGALSSRPALDRMKADAKAKKFDLILVWKIDRLFRRMRYLLEFIDNLCDECDVDFVSATEPFDTTATGKFIFHVFGAIAELERNTIMGRTKEGKISAAKEGKFLGRHAPFGYDLDDRRRLIINKEEAKIIKQVFTWFIDLGHTPEKIAEALTRRKVLTKTDKLTFSKGKKPKRTKNPVCFWHANNVRKILKNETYIGKNYYNRKTTDKDGKEYIRPYKEWIKIACPAIVNIRVFQRVKIRMAEIKETSNSAKHIYLFSGKIKCGRCSSSYTAYTSTKKTKNYRCLKINKTKTFVVCKASQVSEKQLENAIWSKVRQFLEHPDDELTKIAEDLEKDSNHQSLVAQQKHLEGELSKQKNARIRVKEAHREGIYSSTEEFKAELAIIENTAIELQEELDAVNSQLISEETKQEQVLSAQELKKRYHTNLNRLSYDDKREVIQALVNRIVIQEADIRLALRIPKSVQDRVNKSNTLSGGQGQN